MIPHQNNQALVIATSRLLDNDGVLFNGTVKPIGCNRSSVIRTPERRIIT